MNAETIANSMMIIKAIFVTWENILSSSSILASFEFVIILSLSTTTLV